MDDMELDLAHWPGFPFLWRQKFSVVKEDTKLGGIANMEKDQIIVLEELDNLVD